MKRELEDLAQILGFVEVGTADNPRRVRRIDLAIQRAREWQAERLISGDSSRGGSSSPSEQADRSEERSLNLQISRDLIVLQRALDSIGELASVRAAVMRYAEIVDLQKLPGKGPKDVVPGCMSCARTEQQGRVRIGGHFEPIMLAKDEGNARGNSEAHRLRLCRWCFTHRGPSGELPPIKACDLRHSQSERAAGVWLAKQQQAA